MKIENWKMLIDFLEASGHHKQTYEAHYLQFRGQSDIDWKLSSSIQRIIMGNKMSEDKAYYYEKQAKTEFLSQYHLQDKISEYPSTASDMMMMVDMQHYSCPTRLIDWSGSPYIALYFAVKESLETDGALYAWDVRFYYENMKGLGLDTDVPAHQISEFTDYDFVQLVFPTRKNERIIRQQACFTVSNNLLKSHCNLIVEAATKAEDKSGLYKLQIPKELKLEFLSRLRAMNISAHTLFPGLDGLGRTIHENLQLRKWRAH